MLLKVAILQKKTRWKNPRKKLSIEKAKSIRVEAEAIEKAKEKLDISLGNIEKDRENLEKDREAAVQAIEIVIEEKKAQEKLIQDKKPLNAL